MFQNLQNQHTVWSLGSNNPSFIVNLSRKCVRHSALNRLASLKFPLSSFNDRSFHLLLLPLQHGCPDLPPVELLHSLPVQH